MKRPSGVGGWLKIILPWLLLMFLLLLPAAHPSDNLIRLLFITAVWTTTSLAWNLLGGMAGQVSFGFAVFFGLGAYTTALLMHAGHSPYFGFAGGAVTHNPLTGAMLSLTVALELGALLSRVATTRTPG